MSTPQTVSDFVKLARDAVLAKDFDLAETYKKQAIEMKGLDELTPKVDATKRLDLGDGSDIADAADSMKGAAMKAWYTSTYGGDIDRDVELVMRDLYGGDYRQLRYAKAVAFTQWIRTGRCDPRMERLVVYTPEQVLAEIATGATVAELKATQLESQDSSGGLAKAA